MIWLQATTGGPGLLMDAEEYTTVEELLALAADRKGWAERVRQIDPVDHNTAAKMATSSIWMQVQRSGRRGQIFIMGCLQGEQHFNRK